MKTIIEVGAHGGEDTERMLDGGLNRVFAFEPFPEMMGRLQKKFQDHESFMPVTMAVDLESGWRWFNLGRTGEGETGISSLYEIDPSAPDRWQGMTSTFGDRVKVMTTRLDEFVLSRGIDRIDYLWVDAQGNDFRVLQSLGDEISRVQAGRCEAAYRMELYADASNQYREIVAWLEARGFEVAIVPDGSFMETDVHFRRRA